MATDKTTAPVSVAAFMAARSATVQSAGEFPRVIDQTSMVAFKASLNAAVRYCAALPSMAKIDNPRERDAAVMSECATRLNAMGFRPATGPIGRNGPHAGKPYYTGLALASLIRDVNAV